MSDQIPEEGEPIDVRVEATVSSEGMFRVDYGVEDAALLTIQFNAGAANLIVPSLIALAEQNHAEIFGQLLEVLKTQSTEEGGSNG